MSNMSANGPHTASDGFAARDANNNDTQNLEAALGQLELEDEHSQLITTQSVHKTIDPAKWLRLVSILPINEDDVETECRPLECEVHDFPLGHPPSFLYVENSLSFRSNTGHLRPILVSGQPRLISRGLEVCMRRLRQEIRPGRPRALYYILPICMDLDHIIDCLEQDSLPGAVNPIKKVSSAAIDASHIIERGNAGWIKRLRGLNVEVPGLEPENELKYPERLSALQVHEPGAKSRTSESLLVHPPLDRVANEIRLLEVLPSNGDDDAPLEVDVKCTTALDDGMSFCALSYTWGRRENLQTITVGGQPVLIQKNLFDFLKRYRMFQEAFDTPEFLWIDALSINQEDAEEKSHDVQRMSEVYEAAELVYVWLDSDDDDNDAYKLETSPLLSIMKSNEENPDRSPESAHLLMKKHLLSAPDLYRDFARVVVRPYFLRAWCTQELAYAKDVTLLTKKDVTTGWHSMSSFSPTMTDFKTWVELLRDDIPRDSYGILLFFRGVHFTRFQLIHELQRRIAANNLPTLLSLLLATIHLESTDPRDKIYSLWSLASDATKLLKTPDYKRPVPTLFTDFAMAWILEYRSLDILATSTRASGGCKVGPQGLPTWAPDWSGRHVHRPFISIFPSTEAHGCCLDDIEHTSPYHAAAGTKPKFASVNYIQGSQSLLVNGISCDQIQFVGELSRVGGIAPPVSWEREVFTRFGKQDEDGVHMRMGYDIPQLSDLYNALHAGRMITGERAHEFFNAMSLFEYLFESSPDNDNNDLTSEISSVEMGSLGWRNFILTIIDGRRLAITERGHVGLVPADTMEGDEIAVILGCSVPLVLRHRDGLPGRIVLGDCFFRRMMDGAMVDDAGGVEACDGLPLAKLLVNHSGKGLPAGGQPRRYREVTHTPGLDSSAPSNGSHNATESERSGNQLSEACGSQLPEHSRQSNEEVVKEQATLKLQDIIAEARKAPVFGDKPTATTLLLL